MTDTPETESEQPTAAGDDQHQVGNANAKFFPTSEGDEDTSPGDVGGSGQERAAKDDE